MRFSGRGGFGRWARGRSFSGLGMRRRWRLWRRGVEFEGMVWTGSLDAGSETRRVNVFDVNAGKDVNRAGEWCHI